MKINSPPNLIRDKGIYSTWAGSILTSAGPAWDLRAQLMEHEGEDQWVQGWELTGQRSGIKYSTAIRGALQDSGDVRGVCREEIWF